jgi:tRNA1(Val) A37 N6-methylase TrmN6
MRLLFDPALAWQELWAEGPDEIEGILDGSLTDDGERLLLARFERPVLVTDPYRVSLLPPRRRDVVQAFLALPRRTIEYDGVALAFDQTQFPRVWSPSIDTLLVCRAVRELLPTLPAPRAALEIGCGSGYLALYLLEALERQGRPLDELHVVDIDPLAVQCAMGALERAARRTVVTGSLGRRGEALRVRGRYDLVLMNPPYIRRPQALAIGRFRDNPWEGVALLRELSERGQEFLSPGGSLVLVVSSLCDSLVMPWLEASWRVTELASLEVPLKVYAVTSGLTRKSRAWMDFLDAEEGLCRESAPRDGYDTWQTLKVLRCQPG